MNSVLSELLLTYFHKNTDVIKKAKPKRGFAFLII